MSDLATTDRAAYLGQRYGRGNPRRRLLAVAAVGVLGSAGLAWLVWVMLVHGRPLVQSDMVSFNVVDEHAAEATVTVVRRDQGTAASCLLRAQATDHSIVGELSFNVGPSAPVTSTLTRSIRTEREATSVSMVGCTAEGQSRRR